MTSTRQRIWQMVHHERRTLAAELRAIDPEQWGTPSLCTDWDLHDVLAHLIDGANTTRLGFLRRMLAARFDFDQETAAGVKRERPRRSAGHPVSIRGSREPRRSDGSGRGAVR